MVVQNIKLDTEGLVSMVNTIQQANQAINDATEQLTSITEHNDWSCPERKIINDNTLANAKSIKNIQQQTDSFLSVIRAITDEFILEEQNIANMFHSVDEVIAGVGAIQFLQQDHNMGSSITSVAESIQARATAAGSVAISATPNAGDIKLWSLNDLSL